MIKVFRFVAVCTISVAFATLSIAWGQTYTTVDFPGAIATTLNGGPNPQGTSVGSWTDAAGVTHGFALTKKGVFTSFDPPGSTLTTPNFISPQGVIVGGTTTRVASPRFHSGWGTIHNAGLPRRRGHQSHGNQPLG